MTTTDAISRRRFLALPLAGALALGACGDGGGKSIKVVIAEYSKDHTRPFWQALADEYTKQSGVKVDLQIVDWNSIDQQVTTMLQNNQPPDILNLNAFASYAKDGLLHPADDVLSPNTREDFLSAFARGGEYQGKLYGFPILASARAFFYNTELFARAGLAGPPRTWEEFLALLAGTSEQEVFADKDRRERERLAEREQAEKAEKSHRRMPLPPPAAPGAPVTE